MNLYWVGGSGNWSDATNHWATESGGTPHADNLPTSSDDVYFDANSFDNVGQSVSLNNFGYECHNMNWTGATNNPTFKDGTLFLSGSLTFIEDMYVNNVEDDDWVNIYLYASGEEKTIQPAGQHWNLLLIDTLYGPNDKWTLLGDLDVGYFDAYTGTFDANDFDVLCEGFYLESWVDGEEEFYCTTYMGNGTWTIKEGVEGWYVAEYDNVEIPIYPENSTIVFSSPEKDFKGGGKEYNNVVFTVDFFMKDSNSFNDFTVDTPPRTIEIMAGTTQTIGGTPSIIGTDGNLITIKSSPSNDERGYPNPADFTVIDIELVSNGDFTGDADGWDLGVGWSYGTDNIIHDTSAYGYIGQVFEVVAGKYYLVSYDVTASSGVGGNTVFLGGATNSMGPQVVGSYQTVIYALTTAQFYFGASHGVTIDNISVKECYITAQHNISKPSGIVECDYLDLTNSNATGGATWYAGENSIDSGNNTGWIFTNRKDPLPGFRP